MRPVESPSSMISSSACASSAPSSPSWTAATRSASRPRRPSSKTMASTACASPSATSAAAGFNFTVALGMGLLPEDRVQLVLEAAGLDRAVDPALLRRIRLPPPAPGALGLARLDRTRARCATDGRVAAVVEGVIGNVVLAHVVPDLVLRPLGERVELHDRAVVVVDLDLADVRPRRPLVAAQARDPRVELGQVLVQPLAQLVRLVRQAAGVHGEHPDLRVEVVGHVDEGDAVDLKRGRDTEARAETIDRPLEDELRLLALELDRELARLQLVEQLVRAHAAATSSRRLRAGSSFASAPSSSSESRRWKSVNDSPSPRPSSQPRIRPSTAASSPSR